MDMQESGESTQESGESKEQTAQRAREESGQVTDVNQGGPATGHARESVD
jgi:hypothetical protein